MIHGIVNKLGNIGVGLVGAIPLTVPTQYALFTAIGEVTAVIPNYAGEPLLWEQVSGDPVTFTSPLDQITVTFSGGGLNTKVFRCTSNPNTPIAYSDEGDFYHYPIDEFTGLLSANSTITSPTLFDGGLGLLQGGMINHESQAIHGTATAIEASPVDIHTRFGITVRPNETSISAVLSSTVQGRTGAVWSDITSVDRFKQSFPNLGVYDEYRIAYRLYHYGYLVTVYSTTDDTVRWGMSNQLQAEVQASSTVANLQTSLSTLTTLLVEDDASMELSSRSGLNNIHTLLQTMKLLSLPAYDAVAHSPNASNAVSNIASSLQTSFGVT